MAVHGGFVQVEHDVSLEEVTATTDEAVGTSAPTLEQGTRITLLAGIAELAGEIDGDRARASLAEAEARLAELGGGSDRGPRPRTGTAPTPGWPRWRPRSAGPRCGSRRSRPRPPPA